MTETTKTTKTAPNASTNHENAMTKPAKTTKTTKTAPNASTNHENAMTKPAKTTKTTKTAPNASTNHENAMTKPAKTTKTTSTASTTTEDTMAKHAESPITSVKTTRTAVAPSTEQTPSATSPSPTPAIFQKGPPANALIPAPPTGFVPSSDSIFIGVLPRLVELGALPGAVEDLRSFLDYTSVLGTTAPSIAEAIAAFDLGEQWSSMRKASSAWDAYAEMQEGIAWSTIRPIMNKLRAAFELAVGHDPSLATKYANLNTLLTAKRSIAKKGAATKALNKLAVAKGEAPIHGKAGKRRKKAADKAIVAAAGATSAAAATPSVTVAPPVAAPPAATAALPSSPANGAAH